MDNVNVQSPLVGAMTGFKHAPSEYVLLLACDTPFVSRKALRLLLDLCNGKDAAIPRWPNGYLEPLHAAYRTKSASVATQRALDKNKLNMKSMICNLRKVQYVSTKQFEEIDPQLLTFCNINNLTDLVKAHNLLDLKQEDSATT
jgi:molybdopterin-guanine dinucleotide biosynthesis protein A